MKKNEWLKMKKSSFVEGTVIATLAIVFTKILGMIYVIPFYAIVGVQGSALYAYAYNIYNIFTFFVEVYCSFFTSNYFYQKGVLI